MSTTAINETHDAQLRSWVESANAAGADFPIQNLPFGVFRRAGSGKCQSTCKARRRTQAHDHDCCYARQRCDAHL